MALFHFEANTGTRSGGQSARAKLDYIAREGSQHEHRDPRLHIESGHMPAFAAADATLYWQAADDHERANGRLFKHIEIALQRELSFERNLQLARDFVEKITSGVDGGNLPYTFTIHAGGARDTSPEEISRSNIHFDVMISERINDAIDRGPALWFSRAATGKNKTVAEGGAKKTEALKPEAWLKGARKLWADMANEAFAEAGLDCRIDHRTLEEQRAEALANRDLDRAKQLDRAPTEHLGPKALAFEKRHDGKKKSNRRKHIEARQRERENLASEVSAVDRASDRYESQIRADQDALRRERGLRAKDAITRRIAAERAAGKTPAPVAPAAPAPGRLAKAKPQQQQRIQKLGKLPPRLRTTIPKGIAQWARDAIRGLEELAKALARFRLQLEEAFWMHLQIQNTERRARVMNELPPTRAPAPAAADPAASAAQDERQKLRQIVERAIEGKGIHKTDALIRAARAADSESVDRLIAVSTVVLPKALDAAAKSGDEAIFKKLVGFEGSATDHVSLRELAAKCSSSKARAKLNALAAQAKTGGGIEGLGIDPPQQTGVSSSALTKLGKPS